MKHWTIAKRILAGFVAVIAVTAAADALIYSQVKSVSAKSQDLVTNWLPSSLNLVSIRSTLRSAQTDLLENMSTIDPQETKRLDADYLSKIEAVQKGLKDYKDSGSIDGPSGEQAYYDKVMAAFDDLKPKLEKLRALANANRDEEAASLYFKEVRPAIALAIEALQAEVKLNTDLAYSVGNETLAIVHQTVMVLVAGVVLSIILGAVIALAITNGTSAILRRVAKSLEDTANEVSTAAGQVASSSQTLANGSSEQAASLEETSASLEEISSMTKRNAESAANAQDISSDTNAATEAGSRQMDEMVKAMGSIKTSSDNVAKIIKTIDEIAFQTNILALNAAVEAARAGEAGAGFAVVADEVRALAQRAAQAARETSEKIQDSIEHSSHGVKISAKVAQDLGTITSKTQQVDALVKEIAGASKEQSQGLTQITDAVAQMDKVTQSNAASAEETAAAAEELSAQSRHLMESVAELNLLVGSSAAAPSAPVRAPATPPAPKPAVNPRVPLHRVPSIPGKAREQAEGRTQEEADAFFSDDHGVATHEASRR